jgi:c-di-GMP-binding flagellar brake protein YcgR
MVKWFKKEQRKQYRSETEPPAPFELSLILPDGRDLSGLLKNISLDGAAILFPSDKCPIFKPKEKVRLKLTTIKNSKSIPITAIAVGFKQGKEMTLCRFYFLRANNLAQKLEPSLFVYFNRRQAVRVRAPVDEPVEVDLMWSGGYIEARMIDISITGIGLEVDPDEVEILDLPVEVTVSFQLPGFKTFLLSGTALHRMEVGKTLKYGIKFDWEQTEDIERQQDDLEAYVLERQKEMRLTFK